MQPQTLSIDLYMEAACKYIIIILYNGIIIVEFDDSRSPLKKPTRFL